MAKKFRFVGVGSWTLTLKGSSYKYINDKAGNPIDKERVLPKQLLFVNGYAETDDPDIPVLLEKNRHWGNDVFWHPSCLPDGADKSKVDKIAATNLAKAKRRQAAVEAAREGAVTKE